MTISRSTIRDKIGVTEIGLRSATEIIGVHLGTGVIIAWGLLSSLDNTVSVIITIRGYTNKVIINMIWVEVCNSLFLRTPVTSFLKRGPELFSFRVTRAS